MYKKHGRHTYAFLLLLLSEGPSYGALLLKRLQTEFPHCFSDSSDVYRSLHNMENDGLIETNWETQNTGQPRKWYTITKIGMEVLQEQAKDIRFRHENFEFFLARYKSLKSDSL
jgi:PadR family transcriptional regulator PadR